jgi:nicotinate phosphoribosyltransferase
MYELTMAQLYFERHMTASASFEVFVRTLPPDWGYFVMAGLDELLRSIRALRFTPEALRFLASTGAFSRAFLAFLGRLKPKVHIRAVPEGGVFFPGEPVLEVEGPMIHAQLLETLVLNTLGFAVIETTLAARMSHAAAGRSLLDFGLRRAQGFDSSVRAARAAQTAGWAGTSNLAAAKTLRFRPSGTMAHSYVQAFASEQEAFDRFAERYRESAILLVDTYDPKRGIRRAAATARRMLEQHGVRIRGIRIDSGDYAALARYARKHFDSYGPPFMNIYVSGGLDEYGIEDLVHRNAPIDGFGVGTRFATSHYAPDIDIAYKLVEYGGTPTRKRSPGKESVAGRKSVLREVRRGRGIDRVAPYPCRGDLLKPFGAPEDPEAIRSRLVRELAALPQAIRRLRRPARYPVRWET